MKYPVQRNLDGIYFRVERNGKSDTVCFSDMTAEERLDAMKGRSEKWLKDLCVMLADEIRRIGDELDIVEVDDE